MNRFLQTFNFIGVLALVALCVLQWRAGQRANNEIDRLETIRLQQSAKIADQQKTLQENAADLDDFRNRLTISEAALKDSQTKLADALADNARVTAERDAATAERDQLKANLDLWIAAVKARDEAIKKAADEIQSLAADKNDTITKYNDLVGKYNALVKATSGSQKPP
jgi:chromosome segregation ATPase